MAEVFADEKVTLEPDETNQTLTITVQTEEEPLEGKFTVSPRMRMRTLLRLPLFRLLPA